MTDFHQWFTRTTGRWTSARRYIYNMKTMKPTNLTTEFSIGVCIDGEWDFSVDWEGQTSGTMNLKLLGNELHRDIGYFTKDPTVSTISAIDSDTIVLLTSYSGTNFREEIRLLDNDKLRLRQTVGWNEKTGEVSILGQYAETRCL